MLIARNRRGWLIAVWLAVFVAVAILLLTGLRIDSDLGAFLPRARTVSQAALLRELEAGPAARVWLLAVGEETPDRLAAVSRRFAEHLQASGKFTTVYTGQTALDDETQQVLFAYRYLLDPDGSASKFSVPELRTAFENGLEKLHSPVSPFEKQLVTADPTGALQRILDTILPPDTSLRRRDGAWISSDESQTYLLAESVADGTDIEAQEQIAATITAAFAAANDSDDAVLLVSGPPAFAVATKKRIQREALTLSLGSTAILVAILLLAFGSASRVLLISVPLAGAVLIATAVTSVAWGSIHGISLAFGATLVGVSLDYPVHLVSHTRPGETLAQSVSRVWPTLRLGVLTTLLGFAAMLTTDFPGIQQLAVFSISGLLSAALLTRYLLAPLVAGRVERTPRLQGTANSVAHVLAMVWWLPPVVVIGGLALTWRDPSALLSSRIDALSPAPPNLVAQDRALRTTMGLDEPGYVLLVQGDTMNAMLQRQEALRPTLHQAIIDESLRGYDMAALVLPSTALQRTRRDELPDDETLRARIDTARQGLPFRADAFRAFTDDVAYTRTLGEVDQSAFAGTLLGTRLDSLVRREDDGVVGVVTFTGLTEPEAFEQMLEDQASEGVLFIDIQSSTSNLVNAYRNDILLRSALVLILIAGILAVALRDWYRWFRVLVPVLGSILTAAALPGLLGQSLNVFHLVSLLLVAGIGLDYALFFSRFHADAVDFVATKHSLFVCASSTTAVFLVLSLSAVPVLSSIGVTVATGAASAFLLSAFMNRSNDNAKTHA